MHSEQRQTASETRHHRFTYDANGNLTGWGTTATDWRYTYNQLWWVGGSHPWLGSYNWYFTYTPNGERTRLWSAPAPIEGDVNGDGCVDDQDLLQVMFAFGQACAQGCPEDLNRDGQVDDADLLIVQFNFGQCAASLSWGYHYDVWGNLTRAVSPVSGIALNALYDSLGRRVGISVYRGETWLSRYRLYEGDTLLAEVDEQGQVIAEYVWGPLGPLARLDYLHPAGTRYYVLDGLGHTRVLLAPDGQVAEVWSYDSWGNPIEREVNPGHDAVEQPLTWNAAYGYEWDCFAGTNLYHVGAREYDPRTARWLQRDPIDAASGDPNLYRYAGNDPLNSADPSGLDALDNAAHFFAGWGDRLTGGLTGHLRDWLCDLLDLPPWEPRDPCDEWYLAGHLVGAVHDRLLTRGAGGGLGFAKRARRASNALDEAHEEAHNAAQYLRFKKQLDSESQMSEMGRLIPPKQPQHYRNRERLANQYGGEPDEWIKKASSSYTAPDGTQIETHWHEHLPTGRRVEYKTKFGFGHRR